MIEAQSDDPLLSGSQALWTVITSDTRILSFRSAEEIRIAALAGLLEPTDRLMRDGSAALGEHQEFCGTFELGKPGVTALEVPLPQARTQPESTERSDGRSTQPYRLAPRAGRRPAEPLAAIDFSGARATEQVRRVSPGDVETPLGGIQVVPLVVAESLEQAISGALGQPSRAAESQSLFQEPLRRSCPPSPPSPSEAPPHSVVTRNAATAPPVENSLPAPPLEAPSRAWWVAGAVVLGLSVGAAAASFADPIRASREANLAARDDGLARPVETVAQAGTNAASVRGDATDTSAATRALDDGDYELAERLLSQSQPPEQDPVRALLLARSLVAQADAQWIRVRAQAAFAPVQSLELTRLATLARRAAASALRLAPLDEEALVLRVNALRINGELDAAHELAKRLGESGDASVEYALASLELAEPAGDNRAAAARLRRVLGKSPSTVQAQVALTYALLRARHLEAARWELERLKLLVRPHPAQPALTALLMHLRAPQRSYVAVAK
jgi:hypothetical protein